MGIKRSELVVIIFIAQWIFMLSLPCIGKAGDDAAIKELLLRFEQGYEERNVKKYISVFSSEEFEYYSDNATPDDPSDDIRLTEVESERRSALKVFESFGNIDLEMTEPEIRIDGDSAVARSEIKLLVVRFKKPNVPESYYGASMNTFHLRKIKGEWKIIRWQQRESSAEELAAKKQKVQKAKGIEELIQELGDDHLGIWTAAIVALRRHREDELSPLIKALSKSDRDTRIRAAMVLYGTHDRNAVQALTGILRDDRDDVDVRIAALTALSECDGQEVDEALATAARANEARLKSAAFLAMAQRIRKRTEDLHQIAAAGLRHEDAAVRAAAAECLGTMIPARGSDSLEQCFRDRNESESVRLAALGSLKSVRTEPVLSLLRDALRDRTEAAQIRIHAAAALGEAKDSKSLELLIDIAKNQGETFELRHEAIVSLGAIGDTEAVKPLIDILKDADAGIRGAAAASLEQLGDHRSLKPLTRMLTSRNEDIFVRRLAGRGIVKIDRDTAFGPLARLVEDKTESAPARRMAAENLRSFKDERPLAPFTKILKDRESPLWLKRIVMIYLTSVSHLRRFRYSDAYMEALKLAAADPDAEISKKAQEKLEQLKARLADDLQTIRPRSDAD